PWKYLGWEMTKTQIIPQKLQLKTEVKTLNDVQKLVGDLNWIWNVCGISNDEMAPLV
ncbi:POK18 protein, partial [Rhynochetos jubatus]|nr:POK18 protein [Rhynochetos jubatus]